MKWFWSAVVVLSVMGALAWFGITPFLSNTTTVQQVAGSPAGTSFNTSKVAAINISPQSITSTSTSLLNSDASDRIVTESFVTCSGLTSMNGSTAAGVSTFQWWAATSSTAAPTASVFNAPFAAMNITVATSSGDGFTSTSTFTGTAVYARRWSAGTYMVFQTNATSSSAVCQAGVRYLAI